MFFPLIFLAAYELPGGLAATIQAASPLAVMAIAWPLLRERPVAVRVLAALVGMVGVALLVLRSPDGVTPLGLVGAFGSVVVSALGFVLVKRWEAPVPMLTLVSWQLVAGGLLLVPVAFLVEGAPPAVDLPAAGGFLWIGLFGTILAYTCWFYGLRRMPAGAVSLVGLLNPVTGTALGVAFAGEAFGPIQVHARIAARADGWSSGFVGQAADAHAEACRAQAAALADEAADVSAIAGALSRFTDGMRAVQDAEPAVRLSREGELGAAWLEALWRYRDGFAIPGAEPVRPPFVDPTAPGGPSGAGPLAEPEPEPQPEPQPQPESEPGPEPQPEPDEPGPSDSGAPIVSSSGSPQATPASPLGTPAGPHHDGPPADDGHPHGVLGVWEAPGVLVAPVSLVLVPEQVWTWVDPEPDDDAGC